MSRKQVLNPQYINDTTSLPVTPNGPSLSQSLGATFNTVATTVQYQDNISYQVDVTTSDSTGTLYIQGSNDNSTFVTLATVGTVAAANDNIMIGYNQFPFAAVRLRYVAGTAGTGTCVIKLMARTVGA
jgi:hypothetical protein